jgi:hypothetical protein
MNDLSLRNLLVPLLALAAACSDGKDTDTGTDSETDPPDPTCQSGLDGFWPEANATDVFYRTSIEVMFAQEESNDSATLTLSAGGTDVPGTTEWSDDGMTAYFTPNADLMPSTSYTLSVSYSCDKTATNTFTTSATGTDVDATSVLDHVYSIDLFSGRIVEPAGIDDILDSLLAGQEIPPILVSPTSYDAAANEITMRGALGMMDGANIVQDVCTESINFPVAADYANNPFFAIEGEDVAINVADFSLTIDTLSVSGAFASDGSSLDGVSVDAFTDTRPLASLGVGDICELVVIAGVTCIPCSDGANACLKIKVTDLTAEEVPGLMGLSLITTDDVTNNASCAE